MSGQDPQPRRYFLTPLHEAVARLRAHAPWALRPRFIAAVLGAFALVGVAGMAVGYVATKRAVPYFVRIGVVDPAVHTVRGWLGIPERISWTRIGSAGGPLETALIPITFAGQSFPAAVEDLDGNLVVMTMEGAFFYLTPAYELRSLAMDLPMNWDGLGELARDPNFNPGFFRAHDMLAVAAEPGAFDLYVSYDRFTGACFEVAVAKRRVTTSEAGTIEPGGGAWEDLFVAEPCSPPQTTSYVVGGHQVGGRLALLDAGTLLLALGDAEYDGDKGRPDGPQNPDWDLGKLVAISLADGSSERLARGFRNPQGLVVDSEGRIWEAEHGPMGGDEVNLVRRGANYGWPLVTYGRPYYETSSPLTSFTTHEGYERPALAFTPAIGPSQMIEPSAEEFPFWSSSLLLSSLRAESLFVLRADGDEIVYAEPIFIDYRIRDLLSRPDGEIAMVTEERAGGGNLILMRAYREGRDTAPFEVADLRERSRSAAAAASGSSEASAADAGRQVFLQACATCHSAGGQTGMGPALDGVVGRDIAAVDGFVYSQALSSAPGAWTPRRLRAFLVDPEAEFAGTTMPASGITDAQAEAVIGYLRTTE